MNDRLDKARERFEELAGSRTGDPRVQAQIVDQLMRWFVLGRERAQAAPDVVASAVELDNGS